MPRRDPTAYPNPPKLPEGAIGFIAIRPDRPERFALYRPDGTLSNSFGLGDTGDYLALKHGWALTPLPYPEWRAFSQAVFKGGE